MRAVRGPCSLTEEWITRASRVRRFCPGIPVSGIYTGFEMRGFFWCGDVCDDRKCVSDPFAGMLV